MQSFTKLWEPLVPKKCTFQAWNYTEVAAYMFFAPGLGLIAPTKISLRLLIFQWKCQLKNKSVTERFPQDKQEINK